MQHSPITRHVVTFGNEGIAVQYATSQRFEEAEAHETVANIRRPETVRHRFGGMVIALDARIAGNSAHRQDGQATSPASERKLRLAPGR